MKIKVIFIAINLLFLNSYAQNPKIDFKFQAFFQTERVDLDSIFVQNLTKGWGMMITNTVLSLEYDVGIEENAYGTRSFWVQQNKPNPFSGQTEITVMMPEAAYFRMKVVNIIGQEVASFGKELKAGSHSFDFFPGDDLCYILSATIPGRVAAIKMIHTGTGSSTSGSIQYKGMAGRWSESKAGDVLNDYGFTPGDTLRFTGFAITPLDVTGSDVIQDVPLHNTGYTFHLTSGIPCEGMPFVTDADNNVYKTVRIGSQCWMAENLKTTKYRNGTPIPYVPEAVNWKVLTSGAYVWFDSDTAWKNIYGALYNFYAVEDTNNLCPTGWHVADLDDWTSLTKYIGGAGSSSNKLRSCRQTNSPLGGGCKTPEHPRWNSSIMINCGTDEFGFAGFPAGSRGELSFKNLGKYSKWWTNDEHNSSTAWNMRIGIDAPGISKIDSPKLFGMSVRCIRDEIAGTVPPVVKTTDISMITEKTALSGGEVIIDGGAAVTSRGVVWSASPNPTINSNDGMTVDGSGEGKFLSAISNLLSGKEYFVRAYATNYSGTGYGSTLVFTTSTDPFICGISAVSDIEGNIYRTTHIGNHCWMAENLKTTTYRNGIPIPTFPDPLVWEDPPSGAYLWYDNNSAWKNLYGALYNWYAVDDPNGLCPVGWHVPSLEEFYLFIDPLGGLLNINANKLKSCRQIDSPLGDSCNTSEHPRWEYHSTHYGTDDYQFSALPGGCNFVREFRDMGYIGNWWLSSENDPGTRGLLYQLGYGLDVNGLVKHNGFSVRCIRYPEGAPKASFSADTCCGLNPLTVAFTDLSYNNPTSWEWDFGDGGTSMEQNPEYTYYSAGPYTVHLRVVNDFGWDTLMKKNYILVEHGNGNGEPCPGIPTVTDIEGNVYHTALIGSQCWMTENLKTTTFRNGVAIPFIVEDSVWSSANYGAYTYYEGDSAWKNLYGAIYNEYAIIDSNGLCPVGWHVPNMYEWKALRDYASEVNSFRCNTLKSCRQVNSPLGGECNTIDHPRWEQSPQPEIFGTDIYNFSALPGGYWHINGGWFGTLGIFAGWWQHNNFAGNHVGYSRINYYDGILLISNCMLSSPYGFSVRCIKDYQQLKTDPTSNP